MNDVVMQNEQRIRKQFDLIVNAPALFNAIISGIEFGIFKFLSEKQKANFQDLTEFTNLQPDKLRPLLQALCTTELIYKENECYQNSLVAKELAEEGEDSWRHILLGWQKIYYPAFVHMTEALREGTNAKALQDYVGTEPTLYQRLGHDLERQKIFHAAMGAFSLKAMPALVQHPEFNTVQHLLDIGGNDGTTATMLASQHPELRITIFDLPNVTEVAEHTKIKNNEKQIDLHPGDLFKDSFPQGVDAILFSHVLEIFSAATVLFLLEKAFQALPSGGKIFIYGHTVSDDEQRGLYSARLSLYLNILASGEGMAYPVKDWISWLQQIGFVDIKATTDLPYEHSFIIGWKP